MLRAVRRRDPLVRGVWAPLVVALAACVLAACGGGAVPADYDSTGIDELQVPTPSLDPSDFVEGVDNPWLPLAPGTTWRYARSAAGASVGTTAATVLRRGDVVAGVDVVVVLQVERDLAGDVTSTSRRSFAQDRHGNVWLLGERVVRNGRQVTSWQAGTGGAEAGLAMAREPRAGDGYARARVPGAEPVRERVVSVGEEQVRVGAGAWDDVVHTELAVGEDAELTERFHARGVGLVLAQDADGGEVTELVTLTAAGT